MTTPEERSRSTPGPWSSRVNSRGAHMVTSNTTDVALINCIPEAAANAALIAQAPALLARVEELRAALVSARKHCVTLSRGHQDDVHLSVLEVIDAALASGDGR